LEDKPLHPPGMRDISHKVHSLRIATAKATVLMSHETVNAVLGNRAPKGDPIAVARVAATQAAKNTPQFIPYCHPIPIEHVLVEFEIRATQIDCIVTVKAVYKTGVEVEAMAAASIGALNLYDLLKPIDDDIAIESVQLVRKVGGKSDWQTVDNFSVCTITVSDRCFSKAKEDLSGPALRNGVKKLSGKVLGYVTVPDEKEKIQAAVKNQISTYSPDLILLTGGTGIGPRDVTPEALSELIELRLPGIEEQFRRYSQDRIPTAMLSRAIVGVIGQTIVIGLPGSPKACEEAIDCLFPAMIHAISMLKGSGHE